MLRERTFIGYKEENKRKWIILPVMILMSIVLGWFIYKTKYTEQSAPIIAKATPIILIPTETPKPTMVGLLEPTTTLRPTQGKPTLTPTLTPQPTKGKSILTPTETQQIYVAANDIFSVIYKTNRTVIKDSIGKINRYTFYDIRGSMAVHVGSDWSWSHPNRDFNNNLLVDGHNTFVYETKDQKIIDIENENKKYTIQCVHNGLKELINECDAFAKNFKFM